MAVHPFQVLTIFQRVEEGIKKHSILAKSDQTLAGDAEVFILTSPERAKYTTQGAALGLERPFFLIPERAWNTTLDENTPYQ
ncbi:MAG: hypothetical protein RBS07_16025 [Lentimicrobium sp.]|jgi:hypothetical protein|nr:hypothetical protein [Lentimicrobium sp.]